MTRQTIVADYTYHAPPVTETGRAYCTVCEASPLSKGYHYSPKRSSGRDVVLCEACHSELPQLKRM